MADERDRLVDPQHDEILDRPGEDGESPFPAPGDREAPEVEPEEDQQPLTDQQRYGGVSWEEVRKSLPPQDEAGPEKELYEDQHTSERQNEDMKKASWQSPDDSPAS